MADKLSIRAYGSECSRYRDNAISALEIASQRIEAALEGVRNWDTDPSALAVSHARHGVQYAAEGYAALQALLALHDVRFLTEPEGD